MRLISIQLNNYRSYYGVHELEFASSQDENVTLIHGAMGAGKTKLFSAIQWCFYGEEEYDEANTVNKDIMNSIALANSKEGDSIDTHVKVVFKHDLNKYHVTRKFAAFNGAAENHDSLTMLKEEGVGDPESVSEPELEMNSILSKKLRKYFMFDGEKIQNYSKCGHEMEIQDAIKGLLGFDDIEDTIETLEKIDAEYNKNIRKSTKSKELQDVISKIETAVKAISKLAGSIRKNKEEISKGQKLIQKLEKEQASIAKAKEYVQKEIELKEQLEGVKVRQEDIRAELSRCTEQMYVTMMNDIFDDVLNIYSSLEQKGEIPAPIRAEFIKLILENEACICKRPLKKGVDDTAIQELTALFSKQNTELHNLVTKIPLDIANLKFESRETKANLRQKISEDHDAQSVSSDIAEKLKEISDFLKNSDVEMIAMKEKEKMVVEKMISDERVEEIRNVLDKEKLEEDLKIDEKTKNKLLDNEVENEGLRKYQSYTKQIMSELNKLYGIYENETKEKVRSETQSIFSSFMWKKDHYKDVIMQDNYVLDIYDRNGRLAREGLSAGERQCFSLAFVIALARVTGKDAPFIVDTPLGRISKDPGEPIDPRVQILKTLPELLEQIILFVTYEEIRIGDETEEAISKSVGKEYKLEYNEENGCTEIIKIK
jgi:DNA sulfur modification protein DndD